MIKADPEDQDKEEEIEGQLIKPDIRQKRHFVIIKYIKDISVLSLWFVNIIKESGHVHAV